MARHHGMPGRTLVHAVIGLLVVPIAAGFGAFLLLGAISPLLRIAAPLAGLWALVLVLRSRTFEKEFVAKARGAIGENTVGRALRHLPAGWRVFHDVQLEHENIDHVVVSNRGVFTIEVKNYSGRIKVGPTGIYTHGQRNDRIVRQAWRQAHHLRELLGVNVQPVLVFVGRDIPTTRVGSLLVMTDRSLVPWLLNRTQRTLDLETGRRLFALLESQVAGSPRPDNAPTNPLDRGRTPMTIRTSTSHPLQVSWVPNLRSTGALGMTFTPGRREPTASGYRWMRDLDTDLARLRLVHRTDVLISLLERHEYGLIGVLDLPDRAAAAGLAVHGIPLPRGSVPPPEHSATFRSLIAGIRSELDAGKRVVVHSRQGAGRAALVAAAVATTFGEPAEAAVALARTVQPKAVETPEQEAYVAAFAAQSRGAHDVDAVAVELAPGPPARHSAPTDRLGAAMRRPARTRRCGTRRCRSLAAGLVLRLVVLLALILLVSSTLPNALKRAFQHALQP